MGLLEERGVFSITHRPQTLSVAITCRTSQSDVRTGVASELSKPYPLPYRRDAWRRTAAGVMDSYAISAISALASRIESQMSCVGEYKSMSLDSSSSKSARPLLLQTPYTSSTDLKIEVQSIAKLGPEHARIAVVCCHGRNLALHIASTEGVILTPRQCARKFHLAAA